MNKRKIFLSTPWLDEREAALTKTLERAGFEFCNSDNVDELNETLCSVHFISEEQKNATSEAQAAKHFALADSFVNEKKSYKSFFWFPQTKKTSQNNLRADGFVHKLQNELRSNMILSNAAHALQFVEDVITILDEQPQIKFPVTPSEIFIICSESDEQDARKIQNILSDIVQMVNLVIVQESGSNYEEMAAQQMAVCKLTVVYYKNGKEWAIPFAQQLWKKVGGASSKVPICLFGDAEKISENDKTFTAPKVINMVLPTDLIPLEIKVQFDTVNEA